MLRYLDIHAPADSKRQIAGRYVEVGSGCYPARAGRGRCSHISSDPAYKSFRKVADLVTADRSARADQEAVCPLLNKCVANGRSAYREAAYRRTSVIEAEIRDDAEFVIDIPRETDSEKTGLSVATAELR